MTVPVQIPAHPERAVSEEAPGPDTSRPNLARIYDYLLGGKNNFAVDRAAAARLMQLVPDAAAACVTNRRFLQRAVRYLAGEAGIRQFIDIGTGLPTQGSVHEIAREECPDPRVLYVDNDPVVALHASSLLAKQRTAVAIQRDLCDPDSILAHPALRALLDMTRPVAVIMAAVLHLIPDEAEPESILARLKDAIAPGSYVVISHAAAEMFPTATHLEIANLYPGSNSPPTPRTRAQVERFFAGLELTGPGVTGASAWPEPMTSATAAHEIFLAGVGLKP